MCATMSKEECARHCDSMQCDSASKAQCMNHYGADGKFKACAGPCCAPKKACCKEGSESKKECSAEAASNKPCCSGKDKH